MLSDWNSDPKIPETCLKVSYHALNDLILLRALRCIHLEVILISKIVSFMFTCLNLNGNYLRQSEREKKNKLWENNLVWMILRWKKLRLSIGRISLYSQVII